MDPTAPACTPTGGRVIAQSPLVVEPRAHGPELRRLLFGRLVDASQDGLAFVTDERVAAGEALEVSVSHPDGGPWLAGALMHIVDTSTCDGRTLAECTFDRPGTWPAAVRG